MGEVTATLSVSNALTPQDVEVTPTNEDVTIEPAEGCYLRTVVVKAIPTPDEPDTPSDGGDGDGGNGG